MTNVIITGSTGFIGSSLKKVFNSEYNLIMPCRNDLKNSNLLSGSNVIIHLAGIAHDLDLKVTESEYYKINTQLTSDLFDRFIDSECEVFIYISSILALSSSSAIPLTEDMTPNPSTPYAKSKVYAENYILSKKLPKNKTFFILRPPLVYGPGNEGNLTVFYRFMKHLPFWPLDSYEVKKSFCDINNLTLVIRELINKKENVPSGIYHVADDRYYTLREIYLVLSKALNRKFISIFIPKFVVISLCTMGSFLGLPFNIKRLNKLTSTLLVSNLKIKSFLNINFPLGGLDRLFIVFKNLPPKS